LARQEFPAGDQTHRGFAAGENSTAGGVKCSGGNDEPELVIEGCRVKYRQNIIGA